MINLVPIKIQTKLDLLFNKAFEADEPEMYYRVMWLSVLDTTLSPFDFIFIPNYGV